MIGNRQVRHGRIRHRWHRATTANLATLYPFQCDPTLHPNGTYVGVDLATGKTPWHYDPFQLYTDGIISSPNIVVLGMVGSGKSTAVKSWLHRTIGLLSSGNGRNRWCGILDPKGEYGPLANALGLSVIRLQPGTGGARLNPLAVPIGSGAAARRTSTTGALAACVLGRALRPAEDAVLWWTMTRLTEAAERSGESSATLADLARMLAAPDVQLLERAAMTELEFSDTSAELRYALSGFLDGKLSGMFDGETSGNVDFGGRGVVVDLSAVHNDPDALAAVMIAAMGWLQHLLMRDDGIRRIQVWEEIWALLANETTARWFQSCQKLSRDYGVANISVAHRISDFGAQADDGSTTAKVGAGLLADTQTRILFRQPTDQIDEARRLLGLTETEAELLPQLGTGRALWQVGDRRGLVQHAVADGEWPLTQTDGALAL